MIVTSDKIKNVKPHPESMNYLCKVLNYPSNEVIYIGDSPIDKEFTLNSNCYFIPACYDNKELIEDEYACFDPKEILTNIEKIQNQLDSNKKH